MGRYLGPKCKLCRRESLKLFLKGDKCATEKCPFSKRPFAPGMHGKSQSKPSYYALQLREKQKAKRIYGLFEEQFRNAFHKAQKATGVTGRTLLQLLERRLDNTVYRLLFAMSRSHARQLVRHGSIRVNGKKVDIPSYFVRAHDAITVASDERLRKLIKAAVEKNVKERSIPEWLSLDREQLVAEVVRLPEKEDGQLSINEQLIVELYSK